MTCMDSLQNKSPLLYKIEEAPCETRNVERKGLKHHLGNGRLLTRQHCRFNTGKQIYKLIKIKQNNEAPFEKSFCRTFVIKCQTFS